MGWITASASEAAAVVASSAGAGRRSAASASASAAGTSTWRENVAGSASAVYAPPCPGAKATSATAAPDRGRRRPGTPEQRPAGLVRDEHRERGEHGRLVQHDLRRVDARDLGDEREEEVQSGNA